MAERTPDTPDLAVDELKRKARRRLVGAVVLALAAAIVLPMLLEKEPKPLGEDVSVRIPPMDESRLVRSPGDKGADGATGAASPAPEGATVKTEPAAPPAIAAPKEEASVRSDVPPAGARIEPKPSTPAAASAAPASAPKKSIADVEQQMLSPTRKPTSAPAAAESGHADATGQPAPSAAAATSESAPAPSSAGGRMAASPAATAQGSSPSAGSAPTAASAGSGAPAAAPAVAAADGYVVQLAAFADDKGANALAGRLKKGGYAAYVEPVQTSRGTLWRVRIGGYASRDAADAARDKLKTEGQGGIVVPAR